MALEPAGHWRPRAALAALGTVALVIAAAAASGSTSPTALLAAFSRAAAAWALVLLAASLVIATPPLLGTLRRVRSPAFAASLAKVSDLPRGYVLAAATVGGAAEQLRARLGMLVLAEARTGASWKAAAAALAAHALAMLAARAG